MAPESVQRYWESLPSASIDAEGVLRLPVDVFTLGDSDLTRAVFVRPLVHELLFDEVWHVKNEEGMRGIVLTGTPGVGKPASFTTFCGASPSLWRRRTLGRLPWSSLRGKFGPRSGRPLATCSAREGPCS